MAMPRPPPTEGSHRNHSCNQSSNPKAPTGPGLPRRCGDVRRARLTLLLTQDGYIAALRHLDDYRIVLSLTLVVFTKACAQSGSLSPHDGILLGIVIGSSPKDIECDDRFLDLGIPSFQ